MEDKPKIVAKTSEDFQKIEEKLKTLPELIYSGIEIVEGFGLLGLECKIRKTYGNTRIYLPKSTTQITDFDSYIGAYSQDFFFKIPKDCKIDFVFI